MTRKKDSWVDDLRRERLKGSSRNPGSAALMSFFVMGLGQIYAGHIDRGIMLMSIYFGGIFAAVSTYNGGIVYNAVFPIIGAHLMVVISYVVSVVFILLWIYNIKDAYYLSLFSSFRDWFEVERVLLPIIQSQSEGYIDGPGKVTGLISHLSPTVEHIVAEPHQDADVVEISPPVEDGAEDESADEDEDLQAFKPGQVTYATDFGAMKMSGQSWKLYFGLVLIFILIGLWLDKRGNADADDKANGETLFAFAGELKNSKNHAVDPVGLLSAPDLSPASSIQEISLSAATEAALLPFARGLEQAKTGNYAAAAKLFEADLTSHEPQKDEWRVILNSFYRADSIVAYELNLRRYLTKFQDDAAAWFNLGKLLYDRQELAQAAQSIVRGLRIDPENVRGNYLLGSIYIDLKLYNDSITYLERSLALEPLNIDFNRQLARALNAAGRVEESKRYFQRILSLSPDDVESAQAATFDPIAVDDQSKVLVVQGNGEARLLERNNVDDSPISGAGKVLFETIPGNEPEPEPSPEEATSVEIPIKPVEATVTVIGASEKSVEAPEPDKKAMKTIAAPEKPAEKPIKVVAVKPPEKLIKPVEKDQVVVKTLPEKQLESPKEDVQFRDTLAQENRVNAEDIRIEELRKSGASEFSRGNWEAALPVYLEVLKHKRDAQTYDMVGVIFEKLSMHKDAFESIEHSYRLGRKDSATLNKLGRLAETTGNFKKGELYLNHALQKNPHRVDLRIRYARCLDANGKSEIAIAELEKIIRAGGDSYAVRRRAELEIGKIKSARK